MRTLTCPGLFSVQLTERYSGLEQPALVPETAFHPTNTVG